MEVVTTDTDPMAGAAGLAVVLMQLLLVLLLPGVVSAMLFKMDANGKQCISEDAGSEDVIVHATYNVTSLPDPSCKVDIRVSLASLHHRPGHTTF